MSVPGVGWWTLGCEVPSGLGFLSLLLLALRGVERVEGCLFSALANPRP